MNVTGATTDLGTEFIVHTVSDNQTSQSVTGTVWQSLLQLQLPTQPEIDILSVLGNQVSFVVGADGYLILSKVFQSR